MITFNDAKAASRTIARNLNPISVVLFGSVAREGTGYDLDLLIVTDEDSSDAGDRYLLLHRCMKRHIRKTAIDPFIVPLSKWNRFYAEGSPFLELIAREGRPLYMRNAVKEWLKQAEDEFVMARYLIQGGYAKGACYHAQQSVEKAAKAKLLDKGWDLERIHSIERLVAIGRGYRVRFPLTEEDIIFIDAIHRGRYPAEAGLLPMGEPTTTDAQTAVSIAEKMIAYCSRSKGKK
jgi:HEPN domain-containing protein/predicted nucleotidyltransferase